MVLLNNTQQFPKKIYAFVWQVSKKERSTENIMKQGEINWLSLLIVFSDLGGKF